MSCFSSNKDALKLKNMATGSETETTLAWKDSANPVKRGDPIVRLEAGIMNKPPKHFMTKHTIQYKSFQIDHAQAF